MAHRLHKKGFTRFTRPQEPFTAITEMPSSLLPHVIGHLKNIDIKSTPIPALQGHYDQLIRLYSTKMLTAPYYPFYYRARVTTDNNISALMNPPTQYITRMGRCNDVNESLFYCSNCYVTSVLEIKPLLNDIVTVLVMEVLPEYDNFLNYIPLVGLGGLHLHDELMHPFIKSGDKKIQERLDLIDNFFTDIFIQDVDHGEEWKYKSSVALTKCAFSMYPNQHIGLAYPSKASLHYGLNFAVQPKWVDLVPAKRYHAFRLQITKVSSSFDLQGLIIGIADNCDYKGNFYFKDVSMHGFEIDLNEVFYKNYEIAFENHKKTLPEGSFFRRYYPPPYQKLTI